MTNDQPNLLARVMRSASKIEPNELRSVLTAFAFAFFLMAAWYILRPVRDAMASDWTDTEVAILWNLNFWVSALVVAGYGFFVSRVSFRVLVPGVYAFFAASFILFYFATTGSGNVELIYVPIFNIGLNVDQIFYIWVSVFSLFHISVFWSFMSDLFDKEQSNRLFAFIAAGASAGGLVGPAIPALFAENLGNDSLMLMASIVLVVPIFLVLYLERLKIVDLKNEEVHVDLSAEKIGGNPFAGFKMFFTNPYLLAIGAFIFLYTTIGSFVYFEQKNLLVDYTREQRTEILAIVDLVVNILTFAIGMFATSRIVTRFGMAVTLALVPFFIAIGLAILAFAPILTIALVLQIARRAGNYAITRPAREMLFTAVDRETRFKAKPVIDIVVYRGGDAVSSALFATLTDGFGLALGAMAAIGSCIAFVWTLLGRYLGKLFGSMAREPQSIR
ncbi:MAG: MFS transporter [Pseudomonadota bacterium]|nr:MFS transporter [Pseudomonadota bacterium]